jgi:hypothetical protein
VETSAVVEELQEQLRACLEEMMQREEALTVRKEKARISEMTLVKVSVDLDPERPKIEATQKEYLDKMETHTAGAQHSLGLDKILGEKKV